MNVHRPKNSIATELALAKTQVALKKQEIELEKVKALGVVPNGELAIFSRAILNVIKWVGLLLVTIAVTCGATDMINAFDTKTDADVEVIKSKVNELVTKSNRLEEKINLVKNNNSILVDKTIPGLEYRNYVELPVKE